MFVLFPCTECVCLWVSNNTTTSKLPVGTLSSKGTGRSGVILLVIFTPLFLILYHSCQRMLSPQPHPVFFDLGMK